MEATGALQPIANHPVVRDRPGPRQHGQSEAFKRALRQQGGEAKEDAADDDETPMQPELQERAATGRKERQGRHIDVLA